MPAKGYAYYQVKIFPKDLEPGKSIITPFQTTMLAREVDEGPRTVLTDVGFADLPKYRKIHVVHEEPRSVEGRYRNEPIRGFIEALEFHLYFDPDQMIMFADTGADTVNKMLKRVKVHKIELEAVGQKLDLDRLAQDLAADVTGGWMTKIKLPDLSTIALFGGTVATGPEWKRFASVSTVSAVNIGYEHAGIRNKVQVIQDRTVVIYAPMSERDALNFLEGIQAKLDAYVI